MAILKGVATGILLFVVFVIVDWSRMSITSGAGGDGVSIDIRAYSSVVRYVAGLGMGVLLSAGGFLALAKALEIHL
jgi:hypothetical protein